MKEPLNCDAGVRDPHQTEVVPIVQVLRGLEAGSILRKGTRSRLGSALDPRPSREAGESREPEFAEVVVVVEEERIKSELGRKSQLKSAAAMSVMRRKSPKPMEWMAACRKIGVSGMSRRWTSQTMKVNQRSQESRSRPRTEQIMYAYTAMLAPRGSHEKRPKGTTAMYTAESRRVTREA